MTTISPNSGAHLSIATSTKILAGLTEKAVEAGKDLNSYANEVLSVGAEHPLEELREAIAARIQPEAEATETPPKEGGSV